MNLAELKDSLVKGVLSPLYVFTGPEAAIMNMYIHKILELAGGTMNRPDAVADVYRLLQSNNLIAKPKCHVIRDDKTWMQQEALWPSLISGKPQQKDVVILVYQSIDKRSKFYKAHGKIIVEFEFLSSQVLAKYIKNDIELDVQLGIQLAEMCGNDYSRIRLEEDKLVNLAFARKIGIDEAYQAAIKERLIHSDKEADVFTLVDAILKKNPVEALTIYNTTLSGADNALMILSALYTAARSVLLVQGSTDRSNLTTTTGLTAWQIKQTQERTGYYTTEALVQLLTQIQEIDTGIKTGKIESRLAVDFLIALTL